ncbi:hypothetical protein BsWGS_14036 [Bradybaena similaris]
MYPSLSWERGQFVGREVSLLGERGQSAGRQVSPLGERSVHWETGQSTRREVSLLGERSAHYQLKSSILGQKEHQKPVSCSFHSILLICTLPGDIYINHVITFICHEFTTPRNC